MKRYFLFWLAALLLPAFVACQDGRKASGEIGWQDGELVAVAFLGYYDSVGSFETAPSYARLTQTFPQIVEATVANGDGRELYLVVPRDPKATLVVQEIGGEGGELCRSGEGRPVLLYCNDAGADRTVVCMDGAGRSVTFVPRLEPGTAVLAAPADGSVHDLSLPSPGPLEGYGASDYADMPEGSDLVVRVRLEGGQPVLTCSAGLLAEIGAGTGGAVLQEGDNLFSGINGLCKGVFVGTIGQDSNPVVCVVMANGDVKMCSVFHAIRYGGPRLSGALSGFKDVTGFEAGGGGPWEDEDGVTNYGYRTIYALDARGGRTEIPYFREHGAYASGSGDDRYDVVISPDWRFTITHTSRDIGLVQVYDGEFSAAGTEEGARVYPFRLVRYSRVEGDRTEEDESVKTGTFTIRGAETFEIDMMGTDIFPDGTVFRPVR